MEIVDAEIVPRNELDGLPDAECDVAGAPVPSVVVWGFASVGIGGDAFFADDLDLSDGGQADRHCLHLRQHQLDGRMEDDAQGVGAGMKLVLGGDSPVTEHVVGFEDFTVVEIDVGVGVEAGEVKVNVSAGESGGVDIELSAVLPVGEADPLKGFLVVAVEGVGDLLIAQEVHLNQAWDFSIAPLIHAGMVGGSFERAEFPSGVKVDGCGWGGEGDGGQHGNPTECKTKCTEHGDL